MSTSERLPAKIIICVDGTSNSAYIEGNPFTNVTRIARCIKPTDEQGRRQIVWYHPGIGTGFNNPLNVWHQISGNGLKRIIVAAYLFLCNNYNPASKNGPRDEIFLIGFSRGAFAIRCLADFIHQHGVLPREDLHHINGHYDRWKTGDRVPGVVPPVPIITACALWDTVSAIGIPMRGATMRRKFPFIHSDTIESVGHIYQALALHEYRHHFFPIVLKRPVTPANAPNLEQCWFGGFHSDVGGGNESDALAHFPLIWILSKLGQWIDTDMAGLVGPTTERITWRVPRLSDASFRPINSMTGPFRLMGSKYRFPNYEFWCETGIYTCPDPNNEENIHRSTRKLIEEDHMTPFHAVNGSPGFQPNAVPPQWDLRLGQVQLSAAEDRVQVKERKLLLDWLKVENMLFHGQDHPPGQAAPGTILTKVRAWFETPEV